MSEHLCANSEQVFSRLDSELIAPWYSITLYIHPDTIDMLRRDGISRALFLQEMHMWPWVFFARLPTGDIRLDASRPDHRVLMVPRVHAKRYPGELVVACDFIDEGLLWDFRKQFAILDFIDSLECQRRERRGYQLRRKLAHQR
jgi:hypothetical protein